MVEYRSTFTSMLYRPLSVPDASLLHRTIACNAKACHLTQKSSQSVDSYPF